MKHNRKTRKKKYIGGAYTSVTSKDSAGAKLLETAKNSELLETVAKTSASIMDKWVPKSIIREFTGDSIANKDWHIVAPNFFNNINETAELISYAARDPEMRKVLKRTIRVYGEALKDIFHIAEPTIYELTDKFWDTVDNVGVKSARGATNAMIDTISAAVAEVPGLGGAVDLIIALSKWFNAISSGVLAPSLAFSGNIAGKTIKMGRDGLAYSKHHGEKLAKTYNDVSYMLKKAQELKQTNRYAPDMSGGGNHFKVMHNINTSVNRFTKKCPVKMRFG